MALFLIVFLPLLSSLVVALFGKKLNLNYPIFFIPIFFEIIPFWKL